MSTSLEASTPGIPSGTPFACNHCGTVIFTEGQIIGRRPLWNLDEYPADSFLITQPHDWSVLRRYDTSLHQGWYCCRFILMRMTTDKFGTGRSLIVYADSVHPVIPGTPAPATDAPPVRRLTSDDFDQVINAPSSVRRLAIVKIGAIWCPPCRLMDAAINRIALAQTVEGVDFFEIDIDEQPELAARFPSQSIPYTLLYHRGHKVRVRSAQLHTLDGGIVGALGSTALTDLLTEAKRQLAGDVTTIQI
ncbi:thioredoxin family protein [Streptomyces sp. NPDC059688]|uniref:thioredoxin family protein n=1 Tax=Streptomyces sp. NPDC059688 TaxID=3346906 RepID=UPI0036BAA5B6